MLLKMALRELLRDLEKEMSLTAKEIAARGGFTEGSYSGWKKQNVLPNLENWGKLPQGFGMTPEEFFSCLGSKLIQLAAATAGTETDATAAAGGDDLAELPEKVRRLLAVDVDSLAIPAAQKDALQHLLNSAVSHYLTAQNMVRNVVRLFATYAAQQPPPAVS